MVTNEFAHMKRTPWFLMLPVLDAVCPSLCEYRHLARLCPPPPNYRQLSFIRSILIERMAKPEEVIIVLDEYGQPRRMRVDDNVDSLQHFQVGVCLC